MSVLPLWYRDWWDDEDFFTRPSHRLLDQHFGTGLRRDDLLNSLTTLPRSSLSRNYIRPWRNTALTRQDSGTSTIQQDKDKFQVILDVQQFAPNEITVKTSGSSIIVEGKHEEKQDEHGFISRHFVRRYVLPQEHDINGVVSSLSSDGILTVTAPKKNLQQSTGERIVPITKVGPAKQACEPLVDQPTTPQPKVEHPQ